jgi:hypothetical protein
MKTMKVVCEKRTPEYDDNIETVNGNGLLSRDRFLPTVRFRLHPFDALVLSFVPIFMMCSYLINVSCHCLLTYLLAYCMYSNRHRYVLLPFTLLFHCLASWLVVAANGESDGKK